MTHPYHHATSSSNIWGGKPEDYLEIHRILDSSKEAFCDYRHRIMWHHQEGAQWIANLLGQFITVGKQDVPIHLVAEQHILEDCGGTIPTIQDWVDQMPVLSWMNNSQSTESHSLHCAKRFGGDPSNYNAVHQWIDEHNKEDDPRWQFFRHHAEGSFAAEKEFGVTILNSKGRHIPTRYVVEEHLKRDFSEPIPNFSTWLTKMKRAPWMARVFKVQ